MKIETKFNLGDRAVVISNAQLVAMPPVVCNACDGRKIVMLGGSSFGCPKCKGMGELTPRTNAWCIVDSGTIASIEFHASTDEDRDGVRYMFGGDCNVRREENMLPTRTEAQLECDRRNALAGIPVKDER